MLIKEIGLREFKFWGEAKANFEIVDKNGLTNLLDIILKDLYPNGLTSVELNNLLWYEFDEVISEWLGRDDLSH